jgi:trans-aconitate methyltransferase
VQPWDLDIPDSLVGQAIQYGTAKMDAFTRLLASLDIQHELYSFLDLGCGKGRALLLASRFPFKKIIGVELSHELQQTCQVNISRFRSDWQQCTNIVSLYQNATEFTFPVENSVLYLFNPFGAETLSSVVANLEASIHLAPRRVYVIYVKPVHRRVFDNGLWSLLSTIENSVIYVNDMPAIDPC